MMARDLSRALDPVLFARDAGIEPDPWQAKLLRDMPNRALLLCSRQSGKSTVTALMALWVSHLRARLAGFACLSESASVRRIVPHGDELPWPACGCADLSAESALRAELSNGSRIIALPGTERTIRGYAGADLVVIDEAARVEDELIAAMRPMLATSNGQLDRVNDAGWKARMVLRSMDQARATGPYQGYRRPMPAHLRGVP